MPLRNGVQVVVQYPDGRGGGVCRAFAGLPHVAPVWFLLEAASPTDVADAERLGRQLVDALLQSWPAAAEEPAPCGGNGYGSCHAQGVPECIQVLLPVFGMSTQSPASIKFAVPPRASSGGKDVKLIPVLVGGASAKLLPTSMQKKNALHWQPGGRNGIIDILKLAGLVSTRRRIFISYVRADCDPIAEQLFDALGRRGFDVFLDRFRIEPGADFQVRLSEELSRMGSVLVLESPNIRKSKWVRHEINFARKFNLGLVGLALPGGTRVPGVAHASRVAVEDLHMNTSGRLKPRHLTSAIAQIEQAHARAERVRTAYLRDNLSRALARSGFTQQAFDARGNVLARRAKQYAFRVCNVPAELADFHAVAAYRPAVQAAYVIAPARYMDWRTRAPLSWLSGAVDIQIRDHTDMPSEIGRLA